jgi:hypothetical protein
MRPPSGGAAPCFAAIIKRYACLVGGTRSGKTFLILRAIVMRALRSEGSRHAVLRFHANAARASIALDSLPKVMRHCFPGTKLRERRQDGYFELENGSRIWVGGLDDKDRVEKILGLEYSTVFLNEASQVPYSSALVAFTRLAQVAPKIRQRAFVDLNPVGKTHWTNRLFGDKHDPVSLKLLKDPQSYARAFTLNAAGGSVVTPGPNNGRADHDPFGRDHSCRDLRRWIANRRPYHGRLLCSFDDGFHLVAGPKDEICLQRKSLERPRLQYVRRRSSFRPRIRKPARDPRLGRRRRRV